MAISLSPEAQTELIKVAWTIATAVSQTPGQSYLNAKIEAFDKAYKALIKTVTAPIASPEASA